MLAYDASREWRVRQLQERCRRRVAVLRLTLPAAAVAEQLRDESGLLSDKAQELLYCGLAGARGNSTEPPGNRVCGPHPHVGFSLVAPGTP